MSTEPTPPPPLLRAAALLKRAAARAGQMEEDLRAAERSVRLLIATEAPDSHLRGQLKEGSDVIVSREGYELAFKS